MLRGASVVGQLIPFLIKQLLSSDIADHILLLQWVIWLIQYSDNDQISVVL